MLPLDGRRNEFCVPKTVRNRASLVALYQKDCQRHIVVVKSGMSKIEEPEAAAESPWPEVT
jgi:hypothetical protein